MEFFGLALGAEGRLQEKCAGGVNWDVWAFLVKLTWRRLQ